MILFIENYKYYTHQKTVRANKLRKLAGYKKQYAKNFCISMHSIRENKKIILFTVATKRTKYIGQKLSKEVKGPYTEK